MSNKKLTWLLEGPGWWLVILGVVGVLIAIVLTGCEAPDSMYVRSTAGTPVHVYVDNADEFPAGGGGGGDMLKADYDPDEDFVIALAQLDAGIATITMLNTHAGLTTGVHGVGAGTVAKTADITATKLDDFTAPDDNTDLNASTSKHGLLPKLDNTATNYLNGTGAWSVPAGGGGLGYVVVALAGGGAAFDPLDSATYYHGGKYAPTLPTTISAPDRLYILKAGTIKVAYWVWWGDSGTPGSNEGISVYIRLNDSSDTLVETIGNTEYDKLFNNNSLSIAVVEGDWVIFKLVCPVWATNPPNVTYVGFIYIE